MNDKMNVSFSIDWCGEKKHSVELHLDYDETWPDILHHIVKTLENSFGYSFNITDDNGRKYGHGSDDEC